MTNINQNHAYAPLIVAGYALFGLLFLSTLISTTIPFGAILFQPQSMKLNVAFSMILLTVGAILPLVVGYTVGFRFTKSANRQGRHFNGILYGLLAYWVMTLSATFTIIPYDLFPSQNIRLILMNLLPSMVVAIIVAALAVAHAKSPQAEHDALEHKPFQVALVAAVIAMPLIALITIDGSGSITPFSLLPLDIVTVIGLISYISLQKTDLGIFMRITWAAVSVSIIFVALYAFNDMVSSISTFFMPYAMVRPQLPPYIVAAVFAVIGWMAYWTTQTRALNVTRADT